MANCTLKAFAMLLRVPLSRIVRCDGLMADTVRLLALAKLYSGCQVPRIGAMVVRNLRSAEILPFANTKIAQPLHFLTPRCPRTVPARRGQLPQLH